MPFGTPTGVKQMANHHQASSGIPGLHGGFWGIELRVPHERTSLGRGVLELPVREASQLLAQLSPSRGLELLDSGLQPVIQSWLVEPLAPDDQVVARVVDPAFLLRPRREPLRSADRG